MKRSIPLEKFAMPVLVTVALIGLFWGSTASKDAAWCEQEARTLYVRVVEQPEGSAPTISAFLDGLAASLAAGTAE